MSFYTSLSGLQAAQTDMSVTSHNIANVATNGFKKSRTDFSDVIASSLAVDPTRMVGSGVVVKQNKQQFSQGNLTTTSSSLDIAISGDGFFGVKTAGANAAINYTRNGSFSVDTNRFITDAQGSFLQAYPVDQDGNVTATGSDGMQSVKLPETSGDPKATTAVTLKVNLGTSATEPTGTFDRTNAATYNNASATTIYDASGNAQTMTSYYVKQAPTAGSTDTKWSVYTYVGNQELTPTGGTSPQTLTFNATGTMTAPASGAVAYGSFVPVGGSSAQTVTLNLSGSTALSSQFSVGSRDQNGKASGQLSGVTVDENGIINASYSNGDSLKLGKVALANFNNPAGLRQLGTSYWASTGVSGEAAMGAANENGFGNLMSGTLEGSNVDVTEELVALIAAQRNFQANSKALDTQNQISQTIFNLR
jgi:flagellar hook protein FlgE